MTLIFDVDILVEPHVTSAKMKEKEKKKKKEKKQREKEHERIEMPSSITTELPSSLFQEPLPSGISTYIYGYFLFCSEKGVYV